MSTTAVSVVPSNLQLPAHLQSPDIAAAIAAANAAAAGGVRAGGFPTISIKANKFAIKDGDDTTVLMTPPAAPGQPPLPMGCLEVVIVDANPALSHTYFAGEYVEGEHLEPACRSANGITPDADVATKQSASCANCPQYAWGSAVSKLTGKDIRACGDSKQLAVVPANDLSYKMLGLSVKAGSLKNWGTYIQALSGRGYGVSTLVTNITFDQTSTGVLQFSFNRFLTEAEYIKANERKNGDDVKAIVAQSRGITLAPAAALGLPAPGTVAPAYSAPSVVEAAAPVVQTGFGAAPAAAAEPVQAAAPTSPTPEQPFAGLEAYVEAAVAAAGGLEDSAGQRTYKALTGVDYMEMVKAVRGVTPAPTAEPAKRSRRTRAEMEAAKGTAAPAAEIAVAADPLAHIPADIRATIDAVGATSPAGMALIAAYPAPQAAAPAATEPPPVATTPAPAAAAPTTGFGAVAAAPVTAAPTAQVVASGASLAEKLRAKLGIAGAQ